MHGKGLIYVDFRANLTLLQGRAKVMRIEKQIRLQEFHRVSMLQQYIS